MKIALVILHADPARGGAERYTVDLAAALARRGHDASIVSAESLGVRGWTRVKRYRDFLDRLDRHLAETKCDVVHAMLPVRSGDVYHPHAGMAAEALGRASFLFNPRRRAMAQVERELLTGPRPPVVVSLSEYSKRDVLKHYSLPPDRLATLFNAVDLGRFTPSRARRGEVLKRFNLPDDSIIALIIANDFARKGLAEAIRATGVVGDAKLVLLVVGKQDATFAGRLAMRSKARVVFAGGTTDPRPFYEAADFFVLPTKHDPCSLVVLEALAMGVPVISTKFNGACEIMTDGVHGYVLPDPRDVAALADVMRKMLDPARREEMSRACVELRPQLSYEHHLDRLEAIYRDVQSRKS